MTETLDTHSKALQLNLDKSIFGSFAEIGAGQETARWFFRVGAASGTVAKTVSAYDKKVSDEMYGSQSRYVSRERLNLMLACEWKQLLDQLAESRGSESRFFAFANTVAARNFAGTNQCHGWIGIRFQSQPWQEPSEIILHVNMLDPSNALQQEILGVIGVNLIYAAYHKRESAEVFLSSLSENLGSGRLEIDLIDIAGPALAGWNQRALNVSLVLDGLTEGVILPETDQMAPPGEVFYKKPVVLEPGMFENVEPIHRKVLTAALQEIGQEEETQGQVPVGLYCIAGVNRSAAHAPELSDLLRRVEQLNCSGAGVLLFRHRELYRMTEFVDRYTNAPLRFVMGLSVLVKVLNDQYKSLPGSALEGLGKLYARNVRTYIYPTPLCVLQKEVPNPGADSSHWQDMNSNDLITADELQPPYPLSHLYQYLLATNFIVPITKLLSAD